MFVFAGSKGGLVLTKLVIPQWADLRSSVTLYCQFDTGGVSLYSVKWYKDDHEFFQYTPGFNPQTLVFDVDGVNVDVSTKVVRQVDIFGRFSFSFFFFHFFSGGKLFYRKSHVLRVGWRWLKNYGRNFLRSRGREGFCAAESLSPPPPTPTPLNGTWLS